MKFVAAHMCFTAIALAHILRDMFSRFTWQAKDGHDRQEAAARHAQKHKRRPNYCSLETSKLLLLLTSRFTFLVPRAKSPSDASECPYPSCLSAVVRACQLGRQVDPPTACSTWSFLRLARKVCTRVCVCVKDRLGLDSLDRDTCIMDR